jgi:hypothetical protein
MKHWVGLGVFADKPDNFVDISPAMAKQPRR